MHKYNLRRNTTLRGDRFCPSQHKMAIQLPKQVDLRNKLPACFDQGSEGSCGPNSASGLMCFFHPDVQGFSRQQIYYGVRQIENDIGEDNGVETDDLFKVLQATGAAPESLWPYTQANLFTAPSATVLEAAAKYKIAKFSQLVAETDFLNCLAEGFPFILGFEVYESFEDSQIASTGVMAYPQPNEQLLGGHDVLVVGYDTDFKTNPIFLQSGIPSTRVSNTALLIRNSWGTSWGCYDGHFWMPIDYAANAVTGGDAWTGRI